MNAMSLRSAALRLEKLRHPKSKKIAVDKLLGQLQQSELKAVFYAPAPLDQWIDIPPDYWRTVTLKELRTLRSQKGGTFSVPLSACVDRCVEMLANKSSENSSPSEASLLDRFRRLLALSNRRFEVMMLEAEWRSYLNRNELTEEVLGSNAGAPQREKWRDIASLIAAYLLTAHKVDVMTRTNAEAAGIAIHKQAEKEMNARGLPKAATIQGLISQVYRDMKKFQ